MATPIGTLGTIPTIIIGGRVFTDLTNLIILYGVANSSTQLYSGLIKQGGTSTSYQVTTGKTLTINAATLTNFTTVNVQGDLGQCDNALALSTSSTPTNPLYFSSNSSSGTNLLFIPASSGGAQVSSAFGGKIASQKFGFFTQGGVSSAGANILCYGYEA